MQPGVCTSVLKSISADIAVECAHAAVLESRDKRAFESKALENAWIAWKALSGLRASLRTLSRAFWRALLGLPVRLDGSSHVVTYGHSYFVCDCGQALIADTKVELDHGQLSAHIPAASFGQHIPGTFYRVKSLSRVSMPTLLKASVRMFLSASLHMLWRTPMQASSEASILAPYRAHGRSPDRLVSQYGSAESHRHGVSVRMLSEAFW